MGFLSGGMKALTGGSDSSSGSVSGFSLLPKQIQDVYKNYAGQLNSLLPGAFGNIGLSEGEQTAIGNINQGFSLTPESLASNMSMLQNPFDDYVINSINQQATGQNSILNQAVSEAGQFGSNRSLLSADQVEQNRLNNIGLFKLKYGIYS